MIHRVYPYGVVELQGKGGNFRVNAQRLKHYWGDKIERNQISFILSDI